eukprot:2698192-Amphidinium_carterae.1
MTHGGRCRNPHVPQGRCRNPRIPSAKVGAETHVSLAGQGGFGAYLLTQNIKWVKKWFFR